MHEMTRSDPEQLRAAITHLLEHTERALRLPQAPRFAGPDGGHSPAVQAAAAGLIARHDRHDGRGDKGDQ
jgi:hypothetical protein